MRYPVMIDMDEERRNTTAYVPDIGMHCHLGGNNFDEQLDELTYRVEQWLGEAILNNWPIRKPSHLNDLRGQQKNQPGVDRVWALIHISDEFYLDEVERINISISKKILAVLDSHAKHSHRTRSAMIAHMALIYNDDRH